ASTDVKLSDVIDMNDPRPAAELYFYTPELSMLNVVSRSTGRTADVIWFGSRPVADHSGTTVRYTFTGHLGTPILQTSSTAAVVWRAEYEPFGGLYQLRAGTAADDQPLRFPGQQVAYSTSAGEENYNIHRWYRSGWGRYTQADPIGLRGGVNVYEYALDNPVIFSDSNGLSPTPCSKNAALSNCSGNESGCCVAKCIDDLRFSRCMDKKQQSNFATLGAMAGAAFGIGIAPKNGVGTCIGGVVGGAVGYYGMLEAYYGYEWAIAKAGQWTAFNNCMKNCGSECQNKKQQCKNKDLFEQIWNE
ncbi:MAG TPA: RHS repeat-associated core domain-containing protein, partial [Thermoanaerobaculia bacterium]